MNYNFTAQFQHEIGQYPLYGVSILALPLVENGKSIEVKNIESGMVMRYDVRNGKLVLGNAEIKTTDRLLRRRKGSIIEINKGQWLAARAFHHPLFLLFHLLYCSSCICSLYAIPQLSMDLMMGRMDSPSSVKEYSTRGGTSG